MAVPLSHMWFVQGLGFLGLGLGVAGFLSKNDFRLKILTACQGYILFFHFYLLSAGGAQVAAIVNATRNLLSIYPKFKFVVPIFILFYLVFGYYHYEEWIDVLPILASVMTTIGYFYFSGIAIRLTIVFSCTLWAIHNIYVTSIGPLLTDIFILIVNARTIYKLHYGQQPSHEK